MCICVCNLILENQIRASNQDIEAPRSNLYIYINCTYQKDPNKPFTAHFLRSHFCSAQHLSASPISTCILVFRFSHFRFTSGFHICIGGMKDLAARHTTCTHTTPIFAQLMVQDHVQNMIHLHTATVEEKDARRLMRKKNTGEKWIRSIHDVTSKKLTIVVNCRMRYFKS